MNKSVKILTAVCPSCDTRIHFNRRPNLGDLIVCYECDETLKVARLTPLKLDWAFGDDDESWADIDFDDYDDYSYGRHDQYDWD